MRDSLALMAGTPRTVIINDKEYVVNPLTIDDMAEFESYVKSERIKMIANTKGLDPQLQRQLIKEILSPPPKQEGVPDDGWSTDSELQSLMGVRFLLWRMLKSNKSIPPLDRMGELVSMDNLPEIMGIVNEGGAEEVNPPDRVTE